MHITNIKPRRHRMSALFLDGNPTLIDTETLLFSGLRPGDQIDEEELASLKQQSDCNRAYEKALYLLEYRAHSRGELMRKLRAVFPAPVCEEAVAKIEQLGLIDDETFAREFAAELAEKKSFAPRRIRLELEKRGIDRELIDEVLSEREDNPVEDIAAVIRKKYMPIPENQKELSRIYAALARMGYGYGDIKSAIEQIQYD